ncbi:OB-fold domain-containing protein [Streptomyces sp. NPDC001985]|uniref:Zn-ribbon domain-containing OB-fold protein n=1 Tax=Streptomyces sp. NPDC001985 TaxID=3154406 RepID=UPI00332F9C3F
MAPDPARPDPARPDPSRPEIDDFTRPFWDAAGEGRLLLRRCRGCGRAHHHPREFCPYCWSEDVGWETASGRATLYTWSVVHRNDVPPFGDRVPYVAAVVDLAEGPRMTTGITECGAGTTGRGAGLAIGMALEVTFRREDPAGPAIPYFRPAQGQSSSRAQPPSGPSAGPSRR